MAKTILAVDDSVSMRKMVGFTLKSAGYQVTEAADGQEGLDKAAQQKFDLVLTDHNMPVMDGLTLIRALRALPQYTGVPILMLTTESSDAMKAQGKAAGATGWMVKPFDPQRLLDVVAKVIR
jgi:two-component system, chemotaxis family, chemotaxis protein CheY